MKKASEIATSILSKDFNHLVSESLEEKIGREVASLISKTIEVYEPLLLGTVSYPRRWYDWNVGFMLPYLNLDWVADIIADNRRALAKSEGIAWGLGEAGSDDERIVDFLYYVCEECTDYDAWWCAADALEKLRIGDATDLKKRTLKGKEWNDLEHCLSHLSDRAAVIGVLRLARVENTKTIIIPRCRKILETGNRKEIQNAVWILERLRVDDEETIRSLFRLYSEAEDRSHTLRPRIVEAFGQIAAPTTRPLLELALKEAKYYRTRAYAALGLGRIGDSRSLGILQQALETEEDERVIAYVSDAIYSVKMTSKRILNQRVRTSGWPENGMIYDQSNDWYGNPATYDKFSYAEDPLGLSLGFALSLVPIGMESVVDLGTGTGRFTLFAAENRPDIKKIYSIDANAAMHEFLKEKLRLSGSIGNKIEPMLANMSLLPFPDNSIDTVISSWAFPSSMWNVQSCLRQVKEVHRVLKSHGCLVTVGWDEAFRDQLSELWYRFVPEPDFRRESIEEWRKRRRARIHSPRNCYLTFVKKNFRVPLLFDNPEEASAVIGHLFGSSAGEWVSQQQRCEFSINAGITYDSRSDLERSVQLLEEQLSKETTS